VSEDLARHLGEPLGEVVPEMATLVDRAMVRPDRMVEAQITLQRDKRHRTLHARVVCERDGKGNIGGLVVTFDDVSDLLAAQRKAAWADVARRIAHEIKNPLTPIQLSAERLRRKYLKQIQIDPETFSACTDTIIRQVGDIGRMVDEFSSFARMPAPVMRSEDVRELVRRAVILPRNANPSITFHAVLGDDPVVVLCDSRQIGQALTNLLQNAVHAINEREEKTGESLPPGEIAVAIGRDDLQTYVEVSDNGKGLPPELRDRLTDPYVTTRAKGTGLGLAIVKKIMEDHGGELVLSDRPDGGARVRLVFGPQDPAMVAETGSAPTKVTADGV
jgi:two-component system nitrogen regulation sensor histidine kinase NtrY